MTQRKEALENILEMEKMLFPQCFQKPSTPSSNLEIMRSTVNFLFPRALITSNDHAIKIEKYGKPLSQQGVGFNQTKKKTMLDANAQLSLLDSEN